MNKSWSFQTPKWPNIAHKSSPSNYLQVLVVWNSRIDEVREILEKQILPGLLSWDLPWNNDVNATVTGVGLSEGLVSQNLLLKALPMAGSVMVCCGVAAGFILRR